MPLLFRSSQGPWSVWTCRCCGEPAKFKNTQERDWVGEDPHLYIAHHAPIGCPWERKGEVYEFVVESNSSPTTPPEKSAPLTDTWDEKTPVSRPNSLQWWSEEDGAWRDDDDSPF